MPLYSAALQLAPSQARDPAGVTTQTLKIVIVEYNELPAGAQSHIEFNTLGSGPHRSVESRHRILRKVPAIAPMTKNEWSPALR